MDVLGQLLDGFATALTPWNFLCAGAGVVLGTAVGVLPGIGPAVTIALLLPLTQSLGPTESFIMFAGIYYGAMYGGSTTSILLNTPGEAASVITSIEGFPMAKSGRAGPALATAAIGSFVAGTLCIIAITFLAPWLADVALLLQPADYFALMVLAFVSVAALLGKSVTRGLCSLFLGLFIGLIGIDMLSGQPRFTFGIPTLLRGIDVVVVAVGLFAVGEVLHSALQRGEEELLGLQGKARMSAADWARSWKAWLRGTPLGFFFGMLPVGGAEIPTALSYRVERDLSTHPEEWKDYPRGKNERHPGAIEGVAGPEAANNAACSGVLVPLLTLGLPTSATAAILLFAFQTFDLQPGPLLFQNAPELVWALIASLYIGNVMLLLLNLPLIHIWVKLLSIPRPVLYGAILLFATLGVYSVANSVADVLMMYAIGVLGLFMRLYDFPIAPLVLGVILMPQAETQFRRALLISQGDPSVFVTRPFSLGVLLLAVTAMIGPYLYRKLRPANTPA